MEINFALAFVQANEYEGLSREGKQTGCTVKFVVKLYSI